MANRCRLGRKMPLSVNGPVRVWSDADAQITTLGLAATSVMPFVVTVPEEFVEPSAAAF
jgi:hypothetical protein